MWAVVSLKVRESKQRQSNSNKTTLNPKERSSEVNSVTVFALSFQFVEPIPHVALTIGNSFDVQLFGFLNHCPKRKPGLTVVTLHWNEFWARGVLCGKRHLGNALSAGRSSCGSRNLIVKQVWAAALVLNSVGVASSSSDICRVGRAPHRAFPGARALTMEPSEVKKDAAGHLKIDIAGKAVEVVGVPAVSDTDMRKALESGPFQRWLAYMEGRSGILSLGGSGGARCSVNRIFIQSVDLFGQRVGFVKFKADVIDDETGTKLPGIVFARGGAVGILMLLECEGKKYAVLTEQARVPVGRTIMELPAGMLDDDGGDFVGTASREVKEETGINIKISDLVGLTALLDESTGRKMFPSPGGSDEEITLFLYRCHVKKEVIDSLQGQDTGLRDHGELIKVHIVPYDTLWRKSPDSKVLAAIAIYEMALRLNLLPTPPNSPDLSHL